MTREEEFDEAIQRTLDLQAVYALDPSRRPKPTPQELLHEVWGALLEVSEKLAALARAL